MTVRELLSRIDSREISEWIAYENETGPLGSERLDHLVARLAATMVRVNVPKKEDQKKIKDSDFLIDWTGRKTQDGDDS